MFSNEFDRGQYPLRARSRGIILGSILLVAVAAALVSAKTVPFMFAVTVAGFLTAAAVRGQLDHAVPRFGSVALQLAIFLVYAAASAAWALEHGLALLMTGLAALVAIGTLGLLQLFAEETRPNLLHMGEGLWIGFIVGLLYLLVETVTDQSIKIWLYNLIGIGPGNVAPADYFEWSAGKLVAITSDDLNRSMAALALFLWPALMAIRGTLARSWVTGIAILTVLLAGAVVMLAAHETSKLAFVGGLAAFGLAHLARRLTDRLVAIGWVCVCLAVVPAALLAHRFDLHNASWLQSSARHRIIIWNYTAEQVLKAPLLGVGARTTYALGPRVERTLATPPDEAYRRTLSTHAHNVYLQTWFELGLIGATLLTLLGLSILQAMRSLTSQLQPCAYATFVSAAVMAGSSYGMWQIWFVAMFGFCAALFALGAALMRDRASGAAQSQ